MESFLWKRKCGWVSRGYYKPYQYKLPSPKQILSLKTDEKMHGLNFRKLIERTPMFFRGSMTVEASIVLPLFLFLCLNLSGAIEMIRLHGNLCLGLWDAGTKICIAGALQEEWKTDDSEEIPDEIEDAAISYVFVRSDIAEYLGEEYLEGSPLEDGMDSLRFSESEILTDGDLVDLRVTYRVGPLFDPEGLLGFQMSNRFFGHLWNGYDVTGEGDPHSQEAYVYVTEDSEVYHLTSTCTHLKLTIRAVVPDEIGEERNRYGGRYSPCEICAKGEKPDTYYVGAEGDRYHYSRSCYTLNRTYWSIPISEAECSYRPCSRCGGKD